MAGDWFTKAFGASVTDIRQKLVEEAWFGRAVTPRPLASHGHDNDHRHNAERSMAERMGWDRDVAPQRNDPAHDFER